MYRFFVKIKHLPLLSTVVLPFIHILQTFIHIYTHFDSFLTSSYKFGTVYTLSYRCFRISSSWNKLHTELVSLKHVFLKNDLPENFMNKCFKRFTDNIHLVKEKPLVLVLPYLGSISKKLGLS